MIEFIMGFSIGLFLGIAIALIWVNIEFAPIIGFTKAARKEAKLRNKLEEQE